MVIFRARIGLILLILSIWASAARAEGPMQILVLGDSLMTSHASSNQAVPHILARHLGARVKSRATMGARFRYRLPLTGALGMNIAKQYRPGAWDWVVINGGGNDLWLGCGCRQCNRRLNKLITPNGMRGEIPALVSKARASGARVAYLGYLRSPGVWSPIERCRPWGDALEARLSVMAARDRGVTFISLKSLVPSGDRSFHAADMIHPSVKGSAAAAKLLAKAIKQAP